ncbi:MAG: DHH family phosphoesterase [Planctomycetes bacterium]|nr:DHH family phosphoesterase [Planctomycetota bacterium]
MSYDAAAVALGDAASIVITTHINPDGDGIGSGLALLLALAKPGKRVRFLCPSTVASLYGFLPRFAELRPILDEAQAAAEDPCDVMISCDAGDLQRLGAVTKVRHGRLINLDHHVTNTRFGHINLVDEAAESSGVVVEKLLRRLGVPLDRAIAECLYTTIVFDTGRFMHSNTTAHTFRWTAELLETGIDASEINRRLTYTKSPKDLAIVKLALEHLAIDDDPRLAGIVLTAAAIAAVGEPEDWGDLVEIPRSLAGNRVAYLMREAKDGKSVRVSLRSNPPIEVGAVAQAFGGGGHAYAAGCTVVKPLAEAVAEVRARLRKQLA